MTNEVTVGCDPEFFIQPIAKADPPKKETRQTALARLGEPLLKQAKDSPEDVVPINGLVGGTKFKPLQLKGLVDGFTVQEDGIACEFNIPPCEKPQDFSMSISVALRAIETDLQKKGFIRSYVKSVELKPDWTSKHPDLLQIGCDPDFSAYSEVMAPRSLDMNAIGTTRGAGGHVHVGYPVNLCPPSIVARLLDCVLAIPTLEDDIQGARRKFWGVAGLYRAKSYGMEYRTLSNFWIWSGMHTAMVSAHAIALIKGLKRSMVHWQAFYNLTDWTKVSNTIQMEDLKAAKELFDRFQEFKVYEDVLKHAKELMYAKVPAPAAPQFGGYANG